MLQHFKIKTVDQMTMLHEMLKFWGKHNKTIFLKYFLKTIKNCELNSDGSAHTGDYFHRMETFDHSEVFSI